MNEKLKTILQSVFILVLLGFSMNLVLSSNSPTPPPTDPLLIEYPDLATNIPGALNTGAEAQYKKGALYLKTSNTTPIPDTNLVVEGGVTSADSLFAWQLSFLKGPVKVANLVGNGDRKVCIDSVGKLKICNTNM